MFEPLSGFEVRQQHYGVGATLYVLDPKKERITVSENGTTAVFNGESVTLSEDTFGINYGKADSALESSYVYDEDTNGANPTITRTYYGLPKVDTNTYIDDYGKLAEAFVYSEVSSSQTQAPSTKSSTSTRSYRTAPHLRMTTSRWSASTSAHRQSSNNSHSSPATSQAARNAHECSAVPAQLICFQMCCTT